MARVCLAVGLRPWVSPKIGDPAVTLQKKTCSVSLSTSKRKSPISRPSHSSTNRELASRLTSSERKPKGHPPPEMQPVQSSCPNLGQSTDPCRIAQGWQDLCRPPTACCFPCPIPKSKTTSGWDGVLLAKRPALRKARRRCTARPAKGQPGAPRRLAGPWVSDMGTHGPSAYISKPPV